MFLAGEKIDMDMLSFNADGVAPILIVLH